MKVKNLFYDKNSNYRCLGTGPDRIKKQRVGIYFKNIMAEAERQLRQEVAINSFTDIGRIPDYVKGLSSFDGKPTELINWLTEVQEIFNMYQDLPRESVQFGIIQRTVRRKITGEASDVLNSNNITCDWPQIKATLLLYYRDKRDLRTLDYELSNIKKSPAETLGSYFSRVNELQNLIIAQVQTEPGMTEHASSHINYFRGKALDCFIRGLERSLSLLLKTANPHNLNRAYQFCLEYYNMDARTAPFNNQYSEHPIPKPRELVISSTAPPPVPRRTINVPPPPRRYPNFASAPMPMPRFIQNIPAPMPRYTQNIPAPMPRYNQNIPAPMPRYQQNTYFMPKQPPPVPMEVDPSIRSRQVNYGNRPIFNPKRPHPPSTQVQNFKRQAYPLTQGDEYTGYQYTNSPEYYPDNYDYLDDYMEPTESPLPDDPSSQPQQPAALPLKEEPSSSANFLEWGESW